MSHGFHFFFSPFGNSIHAYDLSIYLPISRADTSVLVSSSFLPVWWASPTSCLISNPNSWFPTELVYFSPPMYHSSVFPISRILRTIIDHTFNLSSFHFIPLFITLRRHLVLLVQIAVVMKLMFFPTCPSDLKHCHSSHPRDGSSKVIALIMLFFLLNNFQLWVFINFQGKHLGHSF